MHTPGPWNCERLIDQQGNPYATHYQAHIDIGVCMVWAPPGNAEQEANARLIAAAPEMLDVLKLARVMLDAMIAASNGNIHDHCISTAGRIDEVIQKVTVTDAAQTSAKGEEQ